MRKAIKDKLQKYKEEAPKIGLAAGVVAAIFLEMQDEIDKLKKEIKSFKDKREA